MKKKLFYFATATIFLLSFFLQSLVFAQSSGTATMSFDPENSNVNVNDNVSLDTIVNAGSENIVGVDAYIEYDSTMIEFVSVEDGTFFPLVTSENISPGRLYIAAMETNLLETKTGTGTYASVIFRALKEGTTTIEYFCDSNENETSKVVKDDFDATNIINCSGNGDSVITIASSGTTSTPTPTNTPVDDGDASTGGTDTVVDTTDEVTELPQSGILDNILVVSISGATLLLIGTALKFLI